MQVSLGKTLQAYFGTLAAVERLARLNTAVGYGDSQFASDLRAAVDNAALDAPNMIALLMAEPIFGNRTINGRLIEAIQNAPDEARADIDAMAAGGGTMGKSLGAGPILGADGLPIRVAAAEAAAAASWLARTAAATPTLKSIGLWVARGLGMVVVATAAAGVFVLGYRHLDDPYGLKAAEGIIVAQEQFCQRLINGAGDDPQKLARAEALCKRYQAISGAALSSIAGEAGGECGLLDTAAPTFAGLILGIVLSYKFVGDLF